MSDLGQEVGRKAIRGIRWVLVINVVTLPLSFVMNAILGRVSAEALGQYGAIQVYLGTFQTFVVLGGAYVFTRIVPAMPSPRRLSFLVSYALVVLGLFLTISIALPVVAPQAMQMLLERFGGPLPVILFAVSVATVVWAFCSHFLYAVLRAPSAVVTLRGVVLGNFLLVVVGALAFRETLRDAPGSFLWPGTLAIYAVAAGAGLYFVWTTAEFRDSAGFRWYLPEGFWGVAFYTHFQTIVSYVYVGLAPFVVLLWLDTEALGHLHAAMRYPALLSFVPVMMTSVIAPGISTLDVSGKREEGFRQARAAINGALIFVVFGALAVALFAEDAMAVFGAEFRQDASLLAIVAVIAVSRPLVDIGSGVIVALGRFRAYLLASMIYIGIAIALTAVLVPRFGLIGAAYATTLGALAQHTAIHVVLFRLGFAVPSRVFAAWAVLVAAVVATELLEPDRLAGAALFALLSIVFALVGRVTPSEVLRLVRRALGRG